MTSYSYERLIPFHLVDGAGILFFGHVFTLSHQAFEQFVVDELCPWQVWFNNPEWVVPIKQTEACFHRPLYAGIPCTIELNLTAISNSSFTLISHLKQNQEICCTIQTLHVFCARSANLQKMTIPEELLPRLKELMVATPSLASV